MQQKPFPIPFLKLCPSPPQSNIVDRIGIWQLTSKIKLDIAIPDKVHNTEAFYINTIDLIIL